MCNVSAQRYPHSLLLYNILFNSILNKRLDLLPIYEIRIITCILLILPASPVSTISFFHLIIPVFLSNTFIVQAVCLLCMQCALEFISSGSHSALQVHINQSINSFMHNLRNHLSIVK